MAAEAVNPWFGLATPEFVAEAHAEGLAVYPYTVDDETRMHQLIEAGVDGLFTTHPQRMRHLLRSRPCRVETRRCGAPTNSWPLAVTPQSKPLPRSAAAR